MIARLFSSSQAGLIGNPGLWTLHGRDDTAGRALTARPLMTFSMGRRGTLRRDAVNTACIAPDHAWFFEGTFSCG